MWKEPYRSIDEILAVFQRYSDSIDEMTTWSDETKLKTKEVIWQIAERIEELPTHDTVEVVRREDCVLHNDCGFEQAQGLKGFCSYGERKENV